MAPLNGCRAEYPHRFLYTLDVIDVLDVFNGRTHIFAVVNVSGSATAPITSIA